MSIEFLMDYQIPLVLLACLCVGYCIKHIKWLDRVSNEYIPAILAILGGVLACVNASEITLELVVSGCFTGLASTGLHQMFSQLINKGSE